MAREPNEQMPKWHVNDRVAVWRLVTIDRTRREPGSMKCPNCQTRELVVIEMVMSGEPVALNSCSPCDLRWWQSEGGMLSLAGVLDLAAVGR